MTVGETVRAERKRLGLTQEALARQADMSLSAVTLIEHGKRTDLHHSTLKKLSGALGLTIAQITGEEPIPTGEPVLSSGKAEAPDEGQRDEAADLLADPRIIERLRARGLTWGTMTDEEFGHHVRTLNLDERDKDGFPLAVMELGRAVTTEADEARAILWTQRIYRPLGTRLPVDPDASTEEKQRQRRESLGELRVLLRRRYRRRAEALKHFAELLSDPAPALWERALAYADEAA